MESKRITAYLRAVERGKTNEYWNVREKRRRWRYVKGADRK